MGDETEEPRPGMPRRAMPRFPVDGTADEPVAETVADEGISEEGRPRTSWPTSTGQDWPPPPPRSRQDADAPDPQPEFRRRAAGPVRSWADPSSSPRRASDASPSFVPGGIQESRPSGPSAPDPEPPRRDASSPQTRPPESSAPQVQGRDATPSPAAAPRASESSGTTPSAPPGGSPARSEQDPRPVAPPAPITSSAPPPAATVPSPTRATTDASVSRVDRSPLDPPATRPAVPTPLSTAAPVGGNSAPEAPFDAGIRRRTAPADVAPPVSARRAAVPASPTPTPGVDVDAPRGAARSRSADPSDLRLVPTAVPDPRPTIVEWLALGLAIVVAPVGLLVSIGLSVWSARRRGWVPTVLTSAIIVASAIVVGGAGALAVGNTYAADAIEHRAVEARSQPLCRVIASTGVDPRGSDFGWPAPGDSIDTTVASIQAYVDRWTQVRDVAPSGARPAVAAITSAAAQIEAGIAQSRTISDASNTSTMQALRSQSALPGWVAQYCR